jgi:hypothetical protein
MWDSELADAAQRGLGERAPVLLRMHRVVHRHPRGDFHVHRTPPGPVNRHKIADILGRRHGED